MKKTTLGLWLFLAACGAGQSETAQQINPERAIDREMKVFIDRFPDYKNNGVVREEMTKGLDGFVDSMVTKGYLSGLPLQLVSAKKSAVSGKALLHFKFDELVYAYTYPSDLLKFDVYAHASDSLAMNLHEGKKYFVFGKNYKRLADRLASQKTSESISTLSKAGQEYEFGIGSFSAYVDSTKPASIK